MCDAGRRRFLKYLLSDDGFCVEAETGTEAMMGMGRTALVVHRLESLPTGSASPAAGDAQDPTVTHNAAALSVAVGHWASPSRYSRAAFRSFDVI